MSQRCQIGAGTTNRIGCSNLRGGYARTVMIITRVAFAVLASATFAIDAQPAGAEIFRPWCVQYGGSDGDNGTTCALPRSSNA